MENFNVSILVKARPSKRRMANIQKAPTNPNNLWGAISYRYRGVSSKSLQGVSTL